MLCKIAKNGCINQIVNSNPIYFFHAFIAKKNYARGKQYNFFTSMHKGGVFWTRTL
jgi:hypothetical protein